MRRGTNGCRSGFTLFEVVLAIALSAVLVGLLGTALHVYMRSVSAGRGDVEQAQLARAILSQIADDLRATIRQTEQDVSSLQGQGESQSSTSPSSSGGGGSTGSAGGASAANALEPIDALGSEGDTGTLSSAASLLPAPGVYGTQNELQVDVSRIPRFDELDALLQADGTVPVSYASDIRTVAYYVQQGQEVEASAAAATEIGAEQTLRSGLMRRETDRATALYSALYGGSLTLQGQGKLLAPEVTWIEFQYFDGTQLWTEWDSTLNGGPPLAIEVRIWLRPPAPDEGDAASTPDPVSSSTGPNSTDEMYRMVVHIPSAQATSAASGATSGATGTGTGTGSTSTGASAGGGVQ